MSAILSALRTARELLTDPRRWVQGHWMAHRDSRGNVWKLDERHGRQGNCMCASQAITQALLMNGALTGENREACELELLATIKERTGHAFVNVYEANDHAGTSHADVVSWLDGTVARLEAGLH